MTQDLVEVKLPVIPKCAFCTMEGNGEPKLAAYDGATVQGPWAYMCPSHFDRFGVGLGLGVGQRLVLQADEQ